MTERPNDRALERRQSRLADAAVIAMAVVTLVLMLAVLEANRGRDAAERQDEILRCDIGLAAAHSDADSVAVIVTIPGCATRSGR